MASNPSQDSTASLIETLWNRFSVTAEGDAAILLARVSGLSADTILSAAEVNRERLQDALRAALHCCVAVDPIAAGALMIGLSGKHDFSGDGDLRARVETVVGDWAYAFSPDATVSILPPYMRQRTAEREDEHIRMLRQLLAGEIELRAVFQPIVSLADGTVHGYEALVRGAVGSPLEHPGALFAAAARCDRLPQIDALCARTILEGVARKLLLRDERVRLFMNIHPASLAASATDGAFLSLPALARGLDIEPERLVIEITERQSIPDLGIFRRTLARFRNDGFRVAVDDAGAGYASLEAIATLSPEYIKIDRSLVSGLDREPNKRAMVMVIVGLARTIGARLIAEGVESPAELGTLIDLGVDFAQGYYLGRPADDPMTPSREVVRRIAKEQDRHRRMERSRGGPPLADLYIGSTVDDILRPAETVAHVNERFVALGDEGGMAVVDPISGCALGILMKRALQARLAMPYGHELLDRKPVSSVMDIHPFILDENTGLDAAVRRLLGRGTGKLDDLILVTQDGKYVGSVPGRHLLTRATELQIRQARYANPLTGLPGNVPIEQEVTSRIISGSSCSLVYVDLDHFKPYNDRYGVARGDEAILALAKALTDSIDGERDDCDAYSEDFVGHLGGDDFFVIAAADRIEPLVMEMIRRFESSMDALHAPEDRKRGYFIGHDRRGVLTEFPLLTISVAVLIVAGHDSIPDFAHAAEALSELKAEAKQLPGSSYLIRDLRSLPATGQ